MKPYLSIFFFVAFLTVTLHAQQHHPEIIFEKNNFDDELVYDQIEDILFDRDGFTWLATSTGLYMHDGYTFTTFIHNSNQQNSISENFITTLFEDSNGKIWIGTYNNGLNVFDKEFNSFYNFRHNPSDSSTISSNKIPRSQNIIIEDKQGFIWVSTDNGLDRIDPETKLVKRFGGNLAGQILYQPEEDVVWIVKNDLVRFSLSTHLIETFKIDKGNTTVNAAMLTKEGLIYIGTASGLRVFDTSKNSNVSFTQSNKLHTHSIKCLYEDFRSNIWVGTGNKLYILNSKTNHVEELKNTGSEGGLLTENIRGIYGNGKGKLMITYASQGITKININVKKFRNIAHISTGERPLKRNNVRSIYKDATNNLWVGTYNHGLNKISPTGKIISYLYNQQDSASLPSNYITAIYIDRKNRLWIGTLENGYCYADNAHSKDALLFKRSGFKEKTEIHEFTEDHNGHIWISTNHGFYVYNSELEKLIHYGDTNTQVEDSQHINIQSAVFENATTLWFASWNRGVGKLMLSADVFNSENREKDALIIYDEITDKDGNALDNRFINILLDSNKNIWLASSVDGLVQMQTQRAKPFFTKFDIKKGAPDNIIYSIVEDKQGFIWMSSPNGIGKFNPKNEQFQNYYTSDGLQSNSFIWDSYFQNKEGEIFFGGINGITAFFPDSIQDEPVHLKAYFSKLIINHEEVKMGDIVNGREMLDRNIRFAKSITLTHKESNFSITLSALNVVNPKEVSYSYQLTGFDADWINTTSNNATVTYTNLPPGRYQLKVRSSKNLGQLAHAPTSMLEIVVLPPWWKTIWAYFLYTIIIAVILYFIQSEIIKRSLLKNKLALEHYKHERDNELNKEKFNFFTNLSHELRSPLTLILGPLERMIAKHEGSARTLQTLQLIQSQALRLQKLTNQIMNFRKYEIENLKLHASETNVVEALTEIYTAFRQHARSKQISFKFLSTDPEFNLFFDRDKFEIILVNLLSNAFKFTPQSGKVTLKFSHHPTEDIHVFLQNFKYPHAVQFGEFPAQTKQVIQLEVTDTGIGIVPTQLDNIFLQYFQASNIQSKSGGSGIGLAIVKNYVELHHGSMMVTSSVGAGSTFYVWLPVGKDHLNESDIVTDPTYGDGENYSLQINVEEVFEDLNSEVKPQEIKHHNLPVMLIVDDNTDILSFLRDNFEQRFKVVTATNGREGFDIAVEQIPDIILSDIMMPKVDGLELCREIKKDIRTNHIPFILLTARTANIFEAEGLEMGADDYIAKPFDVKLLNIRVHNLVESRKLLRKRYSLEASTIIGEVSANTPDDNFLKTVSQVVESNIGNSDLKVEWIAREVGMSHSVLYKKILALTDLTVIEFVRTIRLKRAAQILLNTDQPISHISQEVGFEDPKYFSKSFRQYFGTTPSEYRKEKQVP
jgi:signal transduction histidine kinase/ligand-binding sensor domain-containing protein/DNA-binding response OmpR family regulator